MDNIIQLKDSNGVPLYPRTKLDAVVDYDPESGGQDIFGICHADGVTDDADNLQSIIDSITDGYLNFPCKKFFISHTLFVDTSKIHRLNGNNCSIVVSGDFPAFTINGDMESGMTADPSSVTSDIFYNQGGFNINGFKIFGNNATQGEGILIDGVWKPTIANNYICNIKNGLHISNINRDVIIADNIIFKIYNYGVLFDSSVNLHQLNIVGNMISYCRICLYFDGCEQIANAQIVGNDIEIATYPTNSKAAQRCIAMVAGSNVVFWSEIVIGGNTIQGHGHSTSIVDVVGHSSSTNKYIQNVCISSNHIGNVTNSIYLSNVLNVSLTGNTYRGNTGSVVTLNSWCKGVTITGEGSDAGTSFVSSSSSYLYNISCQGCNGVAMSGIASISANVAESVNISNNIIYGNGNLSVDATTLDYVVVTDNIIKGTSTYNIGDCQHRSVNNNL